MRVLILGAGGTGGYFGGVAALAGADVSFLVRDRRARKLEEQGLAIETPTQKLHLVPRLYTAATLNETFDLVVLSCKAYDLDSALDAIAPAVAPETILLPILNGLKHYDVIDARYGDNRVLGGFAQIGVTMTPEGAIRRMSPAASLVIGERQSANDRKRLDRVASCLANENAEIVVSNDIAAASWEKLVFLGTLAAATCLLRGHIAQIQATARGKAVLSAIFHEACAVAAAQRFPQAEPFVRERLAVLNGDDSPSSSSMYRDLLAGNRVEADHILGDLVARADAAGVAVPYMTAAHCQLQVYERARVTG